MKAILMGGLDYEGFRILCSFQLRIYSLLSPEKGSAGVGFPCDYVLFVCWEQGDFLFSCVASLVIFTRIVYSSVQFSLQVNLDFSTIFCCSSKF